MNRPLLLIGLLESAFRSIFSLVRETEADSQPSNPVPNR